MAARKRPYRPPAVRDAPKGILLPVLMEYWRSVEGASASNPVDTALAGEGFYVRSGMGCDMESVGRRGGPASSSHCGDTPCAWFWYRLSAGGVTIGVRACSEHMHSALHEDGWDRSLGRRNDFLAWEVMTT